MLSEIIKAENQVPDNRPELTDAERTNLKTAVRFRIRATAAYPELLKAAMRFQVSLYGKHPDRIATFERESICEPENLLKEHAYVMNAKSTRSQTLKALANAVIDQAGLRPYMHPLGYYRGDSYRIDWYKLPEQWRKG